MCVFVFLFVCFGVYFSFPHFSFRQGSGAALSEALRDGKRPASLLRSKLCLKGLFAMLYPCPGKTCS